MITSIILTDPFLWPISIINPDNLLGWPHSRLPAAEVSVFMLRVEHPVWEIKHPSRAVDWSDLGTREFTQACRSTVPPLVGWGWRG